MFARWKIDGKFQVVLYCFSVFRLLAADLPLNPPANHLAATQELNIEIRILEFSKTPEAGLELIRLLGVAENSAQILPAFEIGQTGKSWIGGGGARFAGPTAEPRFFQWVLSDLQFRSLTNSVPGHGGFRLAGPFITTTMDGHEAQIDLGREKPELPLQAPRIFTIKPSRKGDGSTRLAIHGSVREQIGYDLSSPMQIFDLPIRPNRVVLLTSLPSRLPLPDVTVPSQIFSPSPLSPLKPRPVFRSNEWSFNASTTEEQTLVVGGWNSSPGAGEENSPQWRDLALLSRWTQKPPQEVLLLITARTLPVSRGRSGK